MEFVPVILVTVGVLLHVLAVRRTPKLGGFTPAHRYLYTVAVRKYNKLMSVSDALLVAGGLLALVLLCIKLS